jgi:P-type Cu+ transporter
VNAGGMESDPQGAAVDPVCKMRVDPAKARFKASHEGKEYFFCSGGCQARFQAEPTRFLAA